MAQIQAMFKAFIDDVNDENGAFLQFAQATTEFLFSLIKWVGIPFFIIVIFLFLKL